MEEEKQFEIQNNKGVESENVSEDKSGVDDQDTARLSDEFYEGLHGIKVDGRRLTVREALSVLRSEVKRMSPFVASMASASLKALAEAFEYSERIVKGAPMTK